MLLELLTGRRPVDTAQNYTDDSLVDWVSKLIAPFNYGSRSLHLRRRDNIESVYVSLLYFHTRKMSSWLCFKLTRVLAFQARPLIARSLEEGEFSSLVDSRLQKDYNQNEIARMVSCAAACVRHSARRRPRMSQVGLNCGLDYAILVECISLTTYILMR